MKQSLAQALMTNENGSPTRLSSALISGSCTKALIDGKDYTSLCASFTYQFIYSNGLIVNAFQVGEIFVGFGGYHEIQPSLKRYTLYLQKVFIGSVKPLTKYKVVGTCEMYGDMAKTQATHICKTEGEVNILIEFKSNPKTLEIDQ
jgi:hypothetical protein